MKIEEESKDISGAIDGLSDEVNNLKNSIDDGVNRIIEELQSLVNSIWGTKKC